MRVFVTGATGFIGSAVVEELLGAGNEVLGLARNEAAAGKLAAAGVAVQRGELTDIDALVAGAGACDGVIHTAFIHDFSQWEANMAIDRRAVDAMTGALEGSNKPFVFASGTALVAPGTVVTEAMPPVTSGHGGTRGATEASAIAAAERGVRVSAIRLAPSVHGAGDHGFVPALIEIARRTGVAGYAGEGANRWPAVHRLDAAQLFRRALETAAPGTRLHAVAEEGIAMRTIAEAIAAGLGIPARSIAAADAQAHFGWIAGFAGMDAPASSARTRASMGWEPAQPGLLEDMRNNYFAPSPLTA